MMNEIIKEVNDYNNGWYNWDDETLKNICDSVYDLYTHEDYESIKECASYVFAIYEDLESEAEQYE